MGFIGRHKEYWDLKKQIVWKSYRSVSFMQYLAKPYDCVFILSSWLHKEYAILDICSELVCPINTKNWSKNIGALMLAANSDKMQFMWQI